jgi:exopolysaccharide biosynthesis polyprenyl glycosylphosphotransferase
MGKLTNLRPLPPIARLGLDAMSIACAIGIAIYMRFGLGLFAVTEASPLTLKAHVFAALLWGVSLMFFLGSNRMYDEDTLVPGGGEHARIIRSLAEATAIFSLLIFLTQSFYVSRSWFGLTLGLSAILLISARLITRRAISKQRSRGKWRRPILLVSDRDELPRFGEISEFEVRLRVQPLSLATFLKEEDVSTRSLPLLIDDGAFSRDELWKIVIEAGRAGHSVFLHSPVRSVRRDRLTVRELGDRTIVKVAPPGLTGARAAQKRLLDIVLSVAMMVVLSPLLIVISILVGLTSGLPVLYRQVRLGVNGTAFTILKFRTMQRDAESTTGPVWASKGDNRVTSLGRLLRRLNLDELPQLFNVLSGDMSLVGPRPERPPFVESFNETVPWYVYRDRIKPGITGWAQSHGFRGNTSLESRAAFDNWYIENWSIWLDLQILLSTLREVIRGERST